MEINPHQNVDLDRLSRRRQIQRGAANGQNAVSRQAASQATGDQAALDEAQIQRYVDILKTMDPSDLHRVEDLRARIEDGSYQASVDELIDPLLSFLEGTDEAP